MNKTGELAVKKSFLCFLCLVLILASVVVAQAQRSLAPAVDWKKTYPYRQALWIAETNDGGYAFFTKGYHSYTYTATRPASLIKIDSVGNIQWVQNFSFPFPESIITTSDGGYAYTRIDDDILTISKLDSSGNSQWNRTYNKPLTGHSLIVQTSDNGFLTAAHNVTGRTWDWIIELVFLKTDAQGIIQWTSSVNATGSSLQSMIRTSDGGYALAGSKSVTRHVLPVIHYGSNFAISDDFCLFKISSEGTLQWTKTYGGINTDGANSVVQTSDGGYALVGNTESFGAGSTDALLVKTDASGNLEWAQDYGGFGSGEYLDSIMHQYGIFNDFGNSLVQTSDGGLAFAGKSQWQSNSYYFAWLVKTDIYGNMQWNRTFYQATYNDWGSTDGMNWGANSLIQTKDDSFVMAGYTSTEAWENYFGCFIIKTEPATPLPTTASPPTPMSSFDIEPITINADGSITPSNVPIARKNNEYKFTAAIHKPLIVEADNVVINGQGQMLNGNGTINNLFIPQSPVGIDLFNVDNVTIQDIDIQNFKVGIFVDHSDNITISQNTLTSNHYGVICDTSTDSVITDNKFTVNRECGVYLEYCLNGKVMNNQLTRNGVILYYSSGDIIANNYFTSGGCHPYDCDNILISGNTFYEGTIAVSDSINITIAANSCTKSTVPLASNGVPGITVYMNNFIDYKYPIRIPDGLTYIDGKLANITNSWDNGTAGNYWSNYTQQYPNATQISSSGTWDTPHIIDGNNTDKHPLIAPVSSDEAQALSQALISSHTPSTELTVVDPDYIVFQPYEIPEFPSGIILPLALIITLIAITYRKKLTKHSLDS